MAHIIYRPQNGKPGGAKQLIINGIDYTNEVYRDIRLVEVGAETPEYAEVGLQVTFVLGRLDLDGDAEVEITDHLPAVAQRVRSMVEAVDDDE